LVESEVCFEHIACAHFDVDPVFVGAGVALAVRGS
jgi:hypothetical protein